MTDHGRPWREINSADMTSLTHVGSWTVNGDGDGDGDDNDADGDDDDEHLD